MRSQTSCLMYYIYMLTVILMFSRLIVCDLKFNILKDKNGVFSGNFMIAIKFDWKIGRRFYPGSRSTKLSIYLEYFFSNRGTAGFLIALILKISVGNSYKMTNTFVYLIWQRPKSLKAETERKKIPSILYSTEFVYTVKIPTTALANYYYQSLI